MRKFIAIAFAFIGLVFYGTNAVAQADLWSHVNAGNGPQQLQPATLTHGQLKSVSALLRDEKAGSIWECEEADLDGLIKGLRFEAIPVAYERANGRQVVLAEAPAGCARGGQGANGAMWVIRLDGDRATLLATPKACSGWLFAVLQIMGQGYPDIVVGWHMSGREAALSYLRFDGKTYRKIGAADLEFAEDGSGKIVSGVRKQ